MSSCSLFPEAVVDELLAAFGPYQIRPCVDCSKEVAMGVGACGSQTFACIGSIEHVLPALLVDDTVLQQARGQVVNGHSQSFCHLCHREAVNRAHRGTDPL